MWRFTKIANPGVSPYRLYALSNIGSLLALLVYPFVLEPAFPGYVRYNNRRTGDEVVRVEFPSPCTSLICL